jgi:mono/diheme cytochrome c family protein
MDFPLFYLDVIGNRLLMAIVAVTHVMVNHPLAVGAWPLVTLMEWWGFRRGDLKWDNLAYRVTFVLFIITTSVGALTGVGIWFTAALIAPFGIGTLLRVFFWAWFIEWLVFVTEVGLVLIYFLLWKRWSEGRKKKLHIAVGAALSVFSWFTMAIIVAILGFMMGIGDWATFRDLGSAFFNPLYIPQLVFRTGFAMVTAGLMVWFLTFFFAKGNRDLRDRVVRFVSRWVLGWTPVWVLGAVWYWNVIPAPLQTNLDVGLMTQRYVQWESTFLIIVGVATGLAVLTALVGALRPGLVPRVLLLIPFLFGLYTLGHFERVREFIRKPHVVADYMYSNGVTMTELPVFQRDGILQYAAFTSSTRVVKGNEIEAGRDVYMIACSRCHTTSGVNSVVTKFRNLYGPGDWDPIVMSSFIATMHNTRTFMPPFPGNDAEAEALIAFIRDLHRQQRYVPGAQAVGIPPAVAEKNDAQGSM